MQKKKVFLKEWNDKQPTVKSLVMYFGQISFWSNVTSTIFCSKYDNIDFCHMPVGPIQTSSSLI